MENILELLRHLMDPLWIMDHGGLFVVLIIVFAETGLFLGFFLPGDSLLFVTGMIIASHPTNPVLQLILWICLLTAAGVLGNFTGYWFGRKSGPLLFERRETWLFKRHHLVSAKEFYDKRGGGAIVLARFLPIVRTFAPIVAGIVRMDFKKFTFFNLIGCLAWVISMTTVGFLLGKNDFVRTNLEWIVIGLVLVTTLPVILRLLMGKKKKKNDFHQNVSA